MKKRVNNQSEKEGLTVYTRHPPIDQLPTDADLNEINCPAHITEMGLSSDVFIPMECKGLGFKKEKDPVLAIEALLLAHQNGLYPPLWVMNYLAEAFGEFYESQGKKSLDEIFFSKGEKKKRRSLYGFPANDLHYRNQALSASVYMLKVLFGLDSGTAADLVAARFEKETGKSLDSTSIEYIYTHTFQKDFEDEEIESLKKKRKIHPTQTNDHASRIAFLKKFPKDAVEAAAVEAEINGSPALQKHLKHL